MKLNLLSYVLFFIIAFSFSSLDAHDISSITDKPHCHADTGMCDQVEPYRWLKCSNKDDVVLLGFPKKSSSGGMVYSPAFFRDYELRFRAWELNADVNYLHWGSAINDDTSYDRWLKRDTLELKTKRRFLEGEEKMEIVSIYQCKDTEPFDVLDDLYLKDALLQIKRNRI